MERAVWGIAEGIGSVGVGVSTGREVGVSFLGSEEGWGVREEAGANVSLGD